MMRRGRVAIPIVATVLLAGHLSAPAAQAKHKKKHHPTPTPVARTFDYYVLSLSWSPEHCAEPSGHGDKMQCQSQRHYAFVLHGLWPQYEKGYPQSCSNAPVDAHTLDGMLDIMPSRKLVEHEWQKHGTCSGLPADAYFATARTAFSAVNVPAPYQRPAGAFTTSVAKVKQVFHDANPDLDADEIAVACHGKFLQEVRLCLDPQLHPRACGADVRDGCGGSITVRPVK